MRRYGLVDAAPADVLHGNSSLTPRILPDTIPAPRAIGMKIFGVKGQKLFHEDNETQDWVANNYPYCAQRTSLCPVQRDWCK